MSKHFWIVMRDGSGCEERIRAKNLEDACEKARDWATYAEWGTVEETFWVDVAVEDLARDTLEIVTVQLDPEEPDCTDGPGHDWCDDHEIVGGCKESPGIWGHGGGIVIVEACRDCGCGRHTDTWAQRPDTGEQGLTSVEYIVGEFAGKLAGSAA